MGIKDENGKVFKIVPSIIKELSEKTVKDIYALVLKNIDDDNAGKYREINVHISGSRHRPTHFLQVPNEMRSLLEWYDMNKTKRHPVELAALLHFKFVYIHPFTDGNGRTARLLMNFVLMRHGYPPAVIKAENSSRLKYYELLEKASLDGKVDDFIKFVAESAAESLKKYLVAIGV